MSILDRFFDGADKRQAMSWAFFDFANSSYALLIISFVFPIYYKEVIAGAALGDFYWGLITSISILAGALAAPVIGAIADYDARKKSKFILFTVLACTGTAALYFTGSGLLLFSSLIFILTNFCYEIAVVLYDSFLFQVSNKKTRGRISGLGWGLGYMGGIIAMLLLQPLFGAGYEGNLEHLYKLTFPLTAAFFIAFALPAFLFIREPKRKKNHDSLLRLARTGIARTIGTLRNIRKHKKIAWFLLGFYFINDALVTLFTFVPIYARTTLSLSLPQIATILILVQIIGFPAAVFFGWLSDKRGSKQILLLTIFIWALIITSLSIVTSITAFYIIAVATGLVIGSSQAIARSWLSSIIPPKKQAEFFGFNGFASKVSATTGPVLFGAVSVTTGSQRLAMLVLLPFIVIAFIIFARIR